MRYKKSRTKKKKKRKREVKTMMMRRRRQHMATFISSLSQDHLCSVRRFCAISGLYRLAMDDMCFACDSFSSSTLNSKSSSWR